MYCCCCWFGRRNGDIDGKKAEGRHIRKKRMKEKNRHRRRNHRPKNAKNTRERAIVARAGPPDGVLVARLTIRWMINQKRNVRLPGFFVASLPFWSVWGQQSSIRRTKWLKQEILVGSRNHWPWEFVDRDLPIRRDGGTIHYAISDSSDSIKRPFSIRGLIHG